MSAENYDELEQLVCVRIPALKQFELNWFGGEPLLESRRTAQFTRLCASLCNEHGVEMPPSSVPTNAYGLTPEITDELVAAGLAVFMISLDGVD